MGNLQLGEAIKLSVNAICDKIGFSPELLAEKVGTYENKEAAEIGHYQNETIPTADEFARMFTEILHQPVSFDYSHVAVLQKVRATKITTFSQLIDACDKAIAGGYMTLEEAKILISNFTI